MLMSYWNICRSREIIMSNYEFREDLGKEEFTSLALRGDGNVKSHFLGSYAWGQVSARRNWTPHYVGAYRNGELAATALLLEKTLVAGYSYIYIPRGFTMDWTDMELLQFMTDSIADYCRRHRAIFFKIDPDIRYHTIDDEGRVVPGPNNIRLVMDLEKMGYRHLPLTYFFDGEQPRYTFRIRTDRPAAEIRSGYDSIVKKRLRQAASNGIEIITGGAEDIPEFTRLMTITEKRQDFYSHDDEFYSYFYDILDSEGMVGLYFAKLDIPRRRSELKSELEQREKEAAALRENPTRKTAGKLKSAEEKITALNRQLSALEEGPDEAVITSAQLLVNYAGKYWTMYAGNDMDYGKFYSNYAMFDFCVGEASSHGAEFLDAFGTVGKPGEDSHLDGLHEFKKRWGGEYTEFIGEFEYVVNRPLYTAFKTLIPIRRKIAARRLKK
jgi:peptidoglycan pentaglycine glycine transferase (the first glycine)